MRPSQCRPPGPISCTLPPLPTPAPPPNPHPPPRALLGLCEAMNAEITLRFDGPGAPLHAEPHFRGAQDGVRTGGRGRGAGVGRGGQGGDRVAGQGRGGQGKAGEGRGGEGRIGHHRSSARWSCGACCVVQGVCEKHPHRVMLFLYLDPSSTPGLDGNHTVPSDNPLPASSLILTCESKQSGLPFPLPKTATAPAPQMLTAPLSWSYHDQP